MYMRIMHYTVIRIFSLKGKRGYAIMHLGMKFSHGHAETAYKADDFCPRQKHRLFCF